MTTTTMEPVWNGLLTTDYELSRPDATPLYWDLATRSHIAWPAVLMDDPTPYGRVRRPGIVDIPLELHEQVITAWHALLADADQVAALAHRTTADRVAADTALGILADALTTGDSDAATTALGPATDAIVRVSAVQIVNWLLPEPHYERLLAGLLGTLGQAQACLAALQLPDAPGAILTAAHQTSTPSGEARERTAAKLRRERWLLAARTAAALRDGPDSPLLDELEVIAAVMRWAASCEERRHELRSRFLDLSAQWGQQTGHATATMTMNDLLEATA